MTKEIYISSTPHETRLALVEDDRLAEIYYERENEYTLAGSIYKGRVTRVLPGMQSAFVDIGLERDAFLYVTDFVEENEEGADYMALPQPARRQEDRGGEQGEAREPAPPAIQASVEMQNGEGQSQDQDQGTRRWRGRRGRRRSNDRGEAPATQPANVPEDAARSIAPAPTGAEGENIFAASAPAPQLQQRGHDAFHGGAPTPLVLPGESLSKYRKGDASTPTLSSTPVAASARPASVPMSRPSTLVEAPMGWDGGQILPGESLARYRNAPSTPAAEAADEGTIAAASAEGTASAVAQEQPAPAPVAETETATADTGIPAPDALPVTEETSPETKLAADVASDAMAGPAPENTESATVPKEDLPEDASASYRVDPSSPRPFRFWGHRNKEKSAGETDDPQAQLPYQEEQQPPPADATSTVTYNVQESAGPAPDGAVPVEEGHGPTEETDDIPKVFSPGAGHLEEELIEEEEVETPLTHAVMEDGEFEDLVEETLDVQMDGGLLGDVVRDAHIEERIRFKEGENGESVEEEETDEADVEETQGETAPEDTFRVAAPGPVPETIERPARRPDQDRFRGRAAGRRHNGHGRRATAQTTNMPAITELLKAGQEVLVQIAKEPIARKGARITSHIALPGRFLVFMPTVNHVGVSRKISSDEDRQRLKRILISEKGDVAGGFIVRTAAATASEEDLRADIRFLLNLWSDIRQRSEASKPPALIYHDLDLVERVLRDRVSENFSTIWVDTEANYERVLRFLERFQPSLLRHVKLYTKETPLFEQFGIQDEINKALSSKVWLKSGGSIVINQTEALVAIDINTGKYVGKTARLEDTILKTNLDAIPEIVRQVRLRDLGGIIVIDFIDMDERRNRQKVMQALEEELRTDRAPSKVLQFNDFGLVAITRKRVKQSLERTLSTQCPICTGTGMVKSPVTVCNEIYIELRKVARHLDRDDVLLRVHPDVVKQLKLNNARWINEMEEMSRKTILIKSDPSLHPEQFDIQ